MALALISLPIVAPLCALVALAVAVALGRPILFRQQRPGWKQRPFRLTKFRTMRSEYGADGAPLPDEQRLNLVGRFLRASSLDELPEIFQVLAGEMSFVGPRPLLARYLPYYRPEERKRFEALPGLSGWAQINGRNRAGWDERLQNDVWYVENVSFGLDLRILFRTVFSVLTAAGVDVAQSAGMADLDQERQEIGADRGNARSEG